VTDTKYSTFHRRPSTSQRPPEDESQHAKGSTGPSKGAPVFVSGVVGSGADAHRLVRVSDWTLTLWQEYGDEEPRMLDTDVAKRLGFERPRDIRKLIERVWSEGQRPAIRATVARKGPGRRPEGEYWLTEAQILKVCARSETPVAEAILDEMIAVYMLARRGLLTPTPPSFDAEALARMIDEALRARLASMNPTHDGPVLHNDDRAVVLDPILTLAKRVAGGDATTRDVMRARGRIESRVRKAVQWFSRWCLLPRGKTGDVCAALATETAIATEFERVVAKNRQGSLRLVAPAKRTAK